MSNSTFFNANLIVTNASGEYYGVRSCMRLTASTEHLCIGQTTVTYNNVIEISSQGASLFVQYIDGTGKSCESYLKYNTFLPSTAPKRLRNLVNAVSALIPRKPMSERLGQGHVLAVAAQPEKGLNEVIVYSSKVSFPPKCPVCVVPASKVAKFEVTSVVPSSDLLKFGYWLIPVCHAHKNLAGNVQVNKWSPNNKEINFVFKNQQYAQEFLALNTAPLDSRSPKEAKVIEKINKLRNLKFVIYEYYVSAIFFSFLGLSDIQEMNKDQNQFIRGLKFNAITLTAGWWSFPFGPVHTVIVLLKNFMGGTDVSNKVFAVFAGKPFSASGD